MKQFPLDVTIRTPMHTPKLRGHHATARGPYALGPLCSNVRLRISKVDNDLIEGVCHELGMNRAEFVRWCAVEVAKTLHKL